MNTFKRGLWALGLFLAAVAVCRAQSAPQPPQDSSGILLGSGIGFKPYQTNVRAASSSFIEGGLPMSSGAGFYTFGRVEFRQTDAQFLLEGCRRITGKDSRALFLACGGPGFGANASNLGLSLAAEGKLFYRISKPAHSDTWLNLSMTVDKSTVPAPVSVDGLIHSPVQPSLRLGIFKTF